MIYIATFILAFTFVQLLVALTNTVLLPKLISRRPTVRPLVSVLIPARNEEKNIGNLLNDILSQDYDNIEVMVFNDQSEDLTAEIVEKYASGDQRIRLLNSTRLPAGWLGKNYACHSLSQAAHGEYFLFLDADVRIGKGLLDNSISFIKKHKVTLLTIFPKQIMESTGEKITVPNMNYILLSLLPLIEVRRSSNFAFAAANGQFMMFDSSVYRLYEPHKRMKNNMVEDISTARFLKKEKQRIACLVGDDSIRCRMYSGFNDAVNGFSKNVAAFFGNSLLLASLFWLVTTFGFIFIIIVFSSNIFIIYSTIYLSARILISRVSEQSVLENLIFFIPQQLSCGLFILKAAVNKLFKQHQWKGRNLH